MAEAIVLDRMAIEEAGPNPDAMAAAIHAQLGGTTGPVDVEAIALGLDIAEIRAAPLKSIEGVLVTTPERDEGRILVNSTSGSQRMRFTVAHELGHFLNVWHKAADPSGRFTCTKQDLAKRWSRPDPDQIRHGQQEAEANRFAIELLAPRSRVQRFLKRIPDLTDVVDLARGLDLSREACTRRYVELHGARLAAVFSRGGIVRYVECSREFPSIALLKGMPLPSVPRSVDESDLSNHEGADHRDWLRRPCSDDLIVQTLHQREGSSITLLALEETADPGED